MYFIVAKNVIECPTLVAVEEHFASRSANADAISGYLVIKGEALQPVQRLDLQKRSDDKPATKRDKSGDEKMFADVLVCVVAHPGTTAAKIAEALNVGGEDVKRALRKLADTGKVIAIGKKWSPITTDGDKVGSAA